ncbi:MAG: restriction endonuclease subunit S [Elusimicrobia bacterium]|nr:restriction endonuclease subunit S [Candidatus Liberimonas magnetica]
MRFQPYQKYNNSGIKWIGKIPEHWEVKKIKFFTTEKRNKTTEADESSHFIGLENIESMSGKLISYNSIENIEGESLKFKKGYVLFCKLRPYLAKVIVCDTDGFCTSELIIYECDEKTNPIFFKYRLLSSGYIDYVNSLTDGVKMPRADSIQLSNIKLPLPPKQEQIQIAVYLDKTTDKIDKTIETDAKLIDLLKEKRVSLINSAVTKGLNSKAKLKASGIEWIGKIPEHWEVRKINKLSYVRRGASPRPIDEPKYFDENGEYGWVRIEDVTASSRYLTQTYEKLSVLGKSLSVPLKPGEIFISIAGSVGKPIITKMKCCIHDGFVYFQRLKLFPDYLFWVFIGGEPYKGLGKLGTQLNLNTDTIGNIKIPYPPKSEQIQIVDYLDKTTSKIDKTINKIENKISLLEEYKKSLIHHAVTGKIDIRKVA